MSSNLHTQISQQQQSFTNQLKTYITDLQQTISKLLSLCNYCRSSTPPLSTTTTSPNTHHANNNSILKQLQLMINKLELEIRKYRECIRKVEDKVMGRGGLGAVRGYLVGSYQGLVRDCCQLISMCGNRVKLPKEADFRKIKQFQEEMDTQWIATNNNYDQNQQYHSGYHSKSNPKSPHFSLPQSLPQNPNPTQIQKLAASQIHEQFLAIRLISYKMYEKYNSHTHEKLHEQLQILKQEQSKLQKQITEMKEVRMGLIEEERKLEIELGEVKKINQLIGRRYFIGDQRVDTGFTGS